MTTINKGSKCLTLVEGIERVATVTGVDEDKKTFSVMVDGIGTHLTNIPHSCFKRKPELSVGNHIVNMIEEKYELGLKTVDAAAMTEDIDSLLKRIHY